MKSWPFNELQGLREKGLFRKLITTTPLGKGIVEVNGRACLDFSSNDYLGLSHHPKIKEAAKRAIDEYGVGSRASRLMSGNIRLYTELEDAVSKLKGTEAAIVFGSGYLCNLSIISTLTGPGDLVLLDRLCHASIVDGALLSRARIIRFAHNDLSSIKEILEQKRASYKKVLICMETIYSMDGDMGPVSEVLRLARQHDAMLRADEAHAVGVFGENGEGIIGQRDVPRPDIIIGTFGKALGGYGAFCATTKAFRDYLINKARGLIYSTALPPAGLAANLKALELLPDLENERKGLLLCAKDLRDFLVKELGLRTDGDSQIVPLILNSVQEVLELEAFLKDRGILARAIRPPTVPKDSPRIRFSLSNAMDEKDIGSLKKALRDFFKGRKKS